MTALLERLRAAAMVTFTEADPATGRARLGAAMRESRELDAAWSAWESGTFGSARALGDELVALEETCDAGHHILALVAHVTGDHKAAVVHHQQIRPGYRWLRHLDEPVLWSHVHGGDNAAVRSRLAAFTVTERLWRRFGDWAGLKVEALLSWGFLSHYRWTIDFDRYTYSLVEPGAAE